MISIGIDAGGTLIKIAYMKNDSIEFKKFPIPQLEYVASWISGFANANICITGGKAALLKTYMNQKAAEIVEFEATCDGVRYLLAKNAILEETFILTNVGTGTSIHHVDKNKQQRIGGTGVGGGTIMGLSQLLAGFTDYEAIVALAAKGFRDRIDLKVSHIYEGSEPPVSSIIFIGSTFIGNDLLKEVVERYTKLRGSLPMFIENGEYCGAIGALLYLSS